MKIIGYGLAILIMLVWACSTPSTEPSGFDAFDRKGMLTNLGSNVIIPSFDAFYQKATALETALGAYTTDPKNESKLITAQAAWLDMAKTWKQASLFKQGPIDDQFLLSNIDFSTKAVYLNPSLLETTINSATTIDNSYVESKGSTVKGIHAIEYLLVDKSQTNAPIIGNYTGINGAKRAAYVNALATNLKNQAKLIRDAWQNSYLTTFINADGRDINSSLGILANKMIDQIYTIRDERIGAPKGNRNNGTPQPDLAESAVSNNSITLAINELKSLENAFLGRTPAGVDGVGIDDLLDKLDAKSADQLLSTKIKNQFATVYAKLNAIPTPLQTAVVNNKAEVQAAYDEIKKLQVMLEVDMINNLGVLLTFSDNDGD